MDLKNLESSVVNAMNRIGKYIHRTPLEASASLSKETGANVFLKLENEQVTGSFKVRGLINKLLLLLDTNLYSEGCQFTSASCGNNALACAYAEKVLNIKFKMFVPETISREKDAAIRMAGLQLIYHGSDVVDAEMKARRTAEELGTVYIPCYNDEDVVIGHGTLGLEILKDLPQTDAVFMSVGGGGGISGIATFIKSVNPNVKIIGCQPKNTKVMYESVKSGQIIEEESLDTLSDGTAGGVEENSITFPLCQDYVDDWILVDEDAISKGVYSILANHHKVVEGASGVVVAAFRQVAAQYQGQNVVLVMCGANIGVDKLKRIIEDNIH